MKSFPPGSQQLLHHVILKQLIPERSHRYTFSQTSFPSHHSLLICTRPLVYPKPKPLLQTDISELIHLFRRASSHTLSLFVTLSILLFSIILFPQKENLHASFHSSSLASSSHSTLHLFIRPSINSYYCQISVILFIPTALALDIFFNKHKRNICDTLAH